MEMDLEAVMIVSIIQTGMKIFLLPKLNVVLVRRKDKELVF